MNKILLLSGDGIGPEIVGVAKKVLLALAQRHALQLELEEALIGGVAFDETGSPLPIETLSLAKAADAIVLGAVGGPKWDLLSLEKRPERGLLGIRSELNLFANLRPALLSSALTEASSLKPEKIEHLNILIVRELTGGLYFGEPRGLEDNRAFNTLVYSAHEIERIGRKAFELARLRGKKLCSVDKANVLEVSQLWRKVMTALHTDYPEVELQHMYVDNCAMQLALNPKQFDVIVTDNLFGDILSDLAAALTGSIGMLPSASLNSDNKGLFEPIHGSAPDIAGKNIANPLATILSLSMMLRYSLNEPHAAAVLEDAVENVLQSGLRTKDIATKGTSLLGTIEMGDAVIRVLKG